MTELPSDLVTLPTMPWDDRPEALPLDVQECRTALWTVRGNVTKAAEMLKVPSARLRRFVNGSAYLTAEMAEAKEQIKDIVEENILDALTDHTDPGRKDSMTRFVAASLARDRGYGPGAAGGVSINPAGKGRMVIAWDDGTSIGNGDDAKVINE